MLFSGNSDDTNTVTESPTIVGEGISPCSLPGQSWCGSFCLVTANKTWKIFHAVFTEYDKERKDSMTVEEASYTMNQVQELIQAGIQNKMAAWCQTVNDENANPNFQLPPLVPEASANSLSDVDLEKLAVLLKTKLPLKPLRGTPPKVYTGLAQSLDAKGRVITYFWSHGWTSNLDHNSKKCTRKNEGHKDNATFNNKMGGDGRTGSHAQSSHKN